MEEENTGDEELNGRVDDEQASNKKQAEELRKNAAEKEAREKAAREKKEKQSNPEEKEKADNKKKASEKLAATVKFALEALKRKDLPIDARREIEDFLKENEVESLRENLQQPDQEGDQRSGGGEPEIKDRKAAELIERHKQKAKSFGFRKEAGEKEEYFRSQEQLKMGLSERIRELQEKQYELGDRPGAYTSDGEMTADTQAAVDKLNHEIKQIHNFFGSQEEVSRSRNPAVNELVGESNNFVQGLLARGLRKDQINDLTKSSKLTAEEKATRAKLVQRIKESLAKTGPIDTNEFDSGILFAARHFTELREQLISDILFKSFGDSGETSEYEITLYAGSNLDTLLGFLSVDDKTRYKELYSLRTAARFFQTMNSTIVKGNFEHFGQSAENINYQHFENMRDIGGSGLAMRLYEQAYKDALATDKRIMQDNIEGIKEFVEKTFNEINEAGLIKSEYSQYRESSKMENWEVERALAAGRTFLNITLRNAESIATGRVPDDERIFASEPQEDMVRIINWNEWLLRKFMVGGNETGRHGKEFLDMSGKEFQKFLRYKGAKLDKNKITEFGGVNVKKMEDGGQYRTSGIYSGWRLQTMAFDQIYLRDEKGNMIRDEERVLRSQDNKITKDKDGKAFMTVKGFRDQSEIKARIKALKDKVEAYAKANPNKDPKDQVTKEHQKEYMDIFMPVVNKINFGLSALLKNGDFGMQDNKLGYLLREEIWKKIARTNTPIMINYLTDIKYEWSGLYGDKGIMKKIEDLKAKGNKSEEDRSEEAKLIKERDELMKKKAKAEQDGFAEAKTLEQLRSEAGEGWRDEKKWKDFKNKILINFERTIKEGMGEDLPPVAKEYKLDVDEKKMENAIRLEGEKLAPHLADIVFAYTPFMNDMPFEKFNYVIPGQTFYKRRTTSDLGGFNKGQQAFNKILDNPGGISAEEASKAMLEIVQGIAGPEGPRAGMEANFPTFAALLDVVTTDPLARQAMFKFLLEFTRTETSTAQRWAGMKADSFTEAQATALIDDATKAGILNPYLARYMKKNKHLTFSSILWMLFRDIYVLVPVVATAEFVGTLSKGK